jgi:hypothetical protein
MTNPSPALPNPFLAAPAGSRSPAPAWFAARPALTVFLLCLAVGAPIIAWRAHRRGHEARARARSELLARGAALELQFNQAVSAAEVLGALARQSGGTIPNFQKVAAEVLAAHRGLASLELQPGGIVGDIVPRAGNERVLGFNVLTNPVYGPAANAAIQKRALTLTGPLPLYHGDAGIIARVPIFVRGRDGRDAFWGFVAASMRLSEALALARVDDLAGVGYHYRVFGPAPAGREPATIAAHGALPIPDAEKQLLRPQDLRFTLAVEPPGGWISKSRLLLECLCVLAGASLLCLIVNVLESRQAVEMALAEANQRLLRETADGQQAQNDFRSATDEAAAVRAELERTRAALQSSTTAELRLQAATRTAEALAQSRYIELEQLQAARQQAEQTIASLQARLNAASEKAAPQAPQIQPETAQATSADVETRPAAASRPVPETDKASAVQAAPAPEAPAETPNESSGPVALAPSEAEKAPKLEDVVGPGPETPPQTPESPPEPPDRTPSPSGPLQPPPSERRIRRTRSANTGRSKPPPSGKQGVEAPPEPPTRAGSPGGPEQVYASPGAHSASAPQREELKDGLDARQEAAGVPLESPATKAEEVAGPPTAAAEPVSSPAAASNPEPATPPAGVPPPKPPSEKPPRAPRRKKLQRDNQMGLFEPLATAAPARATPTGDAAVKEPAIQTAPVPPAEPPPAEAAAALPEPESAAPATREESPAEPKPAPIPKEERPRPLPALPPLHPALLRKAVNQILPLFEGKDPGARDCLKANRTTFRSAFTPEGYVEFEQSVKRGDFDTALEHLKRAAKRHGIPV